MEAADETLEFLSLLFNEADANGNGLLNEQELIQVWRAVRLHSLEMLASLCRIYRRTPDAAPVPGRLFVVPVATPPRMKMMMSLPRM